MFKSRPGQLFYQFFRVDAFDIILIVISVYARKLHHKAWWRNGSASDSTSEGCVFKSRTCQPFYQFLRVDAIYIILIVISVYARKRHRKAWWRNGSASDSSSEGCVFKSRPGQLLFQFFRVDAFDIILIVISVYARKLYHKAWWRNGSASDSSSEGCVFESHLGQLFYQFLRVDAFGIISVVISVHPRKCSQEAWWRNGSARDSSSEGCLFKSRPGQLFYQFFRVDAFDIILIVISVFE